MHIQIDRIETVTLRGKEVEQLWRLLKNECENAGQAEATTYGMYQNLRIFFEKSEPLPHCPKCGKEMTPCDRHMECIYCGHEED